MNDKELNELKEKYNQLLLRHCKAFIYLEDNKVPFADREKWMPKYKEILDELEEIYCTLYYNGYIAYPDEILGGFHIDNEI